MQTLIVEDDDLMADLMETVVAGLQPGMRVVKAATLSEAVQRWQRDAPNLLVIDWNLPDGDGLQLVRAVRARDPDVPIVMITGRADRQSILTAAHYHINGYITKPFKVEMLHSRLQALVATLAEPAVGDEDAGEALDTVLAEELESVIQMPARTDAAAILALMSRTEELSAGQLAERWQKDVALCTRLLEVANSSSFRRTGKPVGDVRDAISLLGVGMALNYALAMALDVAARFQDGHLRALAHDYLAQSERVAAEAQRIALALGKRRASVYYTAGLLSRIGELAVLKVMDQHVRQGHAVTEEEARIGLQDWAQPYGNKLKVQWHLPLELRQMIGAVHYLPRENLTQDRIIMRAAGLLADEGEPVDECRRLLRLLGLEEWLGDRGTGAGTQND